LAALKTAEAKKPTNVRSSIQKLNTSQTYNCYGKWNDPLSRVVGHYAYTPKAEQNNVQKWNEEVGNILRDMENLVFRGLRYLLSSRDFSELQDNYQIPVAFDGATLQRHLHWYITTGQQYI
jgi:hypothetical protein